MNDMQNMQTLVISLLISIAGVLGWVIVQVVNIPETYVQKEHYLSAYNKTTNDISLLMTKADKNTEIDSDIFRTLQDEIRKEEIRNIKDIKDLKKSLRKDIRSIEKELNYHLNKDKKHE